MLLMGNPAPLPTRICSFPEYDSDKRLSWDKSWVIWWVAAESGYRVESGMAEPQKERCSWLRRSEVVHIGKHGQIDSGIGEQYDLV